MENIIDTNNIDHYLYNQAINKFDKYQQYLKTSQRKYKNFNELNEDICLHLYNPNLEINDREDMNTEYQSNYDMFEKLESLDLFNRDNIREMCAYDMYYSMLVSKLLGEKLIKILNNKKFKNSGQNNSNNSNSIKGNSSSQEDDSSSQGDSELKDILDNIENKAMDEKQLCKSFGIEQGLKTYSFENRSKLVESMINNNKLRELSKILGRFNSMGRIGNKKSENSISIDDVTVGNDVRKLLPSEKMKLCNKTTKADFYNRYTNKQLLQYDNGKSSGKFKGSIITCLDFSLSMRGAEELYAKALMVKLSEIAKQEKRNFVAILFTMEIIDIYEQSKYNNNPSKLLEILKLNPDGGTDFEEPLNKALEFINKDKYNNADIVFITDGCCSIEKPFKEKFNKIKTKKGFKVYSINLSGEAYNIYAMDSLGNINLDEPTNAPNILKEFSDEIINISDLTKDGIKSMNNLLSNI